MNRAHPWMPVSPCDDSCLPSADGVATIARTRRTLRLLNVGAMLVAGAALAVVLPLLGRASRDRTLRAWYRRLLRALRVQLEVTGDDRFAAQGVGVLVVSNHVSWLDLVALGAVQPLRMVAKREVRKWLVVGPLARRIGTVFVDRERLSTLPGMVAAVSGALTGGAAVGAFPEGTTWCGLAGGRFRPAVFQAAVDTATLVRPVALRYSLSGAGGTTVASFVGTTTLWEAAVRLAGVRGLVVKVHVLPLLDPAGSNRRALATRAERAVTSVTLPLIPQPYTAYRALGTDCSNSHALKCSLSPERADWGRD